MRKVCKRCGIDKPTADFHKNPATKDGLHSYCRSCNTALAAQNRMSRTLKEKKRKEAVDMAVVEAQFMPLVTMALADLQAEFRHSLNDVDTIHNSTKEMLLTELHVCAGLVRASILEMIKKNDNL